MYSVLLFICFLLPIPSFAGVGGELLKDSDPRLVRFSMDCKGYLLNDHQVLTAAHCMLYSIEAKLVLGKKYEPGFLGYVIDHKGSLLKILDYRVPSTFVWNRISKMSTAELKSDVAVLDIEPVPGWSSEIDFSIASFEENSPPYGLSYRNGEGSKQHKVVFKKQLIADNEEQLKFSFFRSFLFEERNFRKYGYLCRGDSGSPLFQIQKSGKKLLVGVVSKGAHKSDSCDSSINISYTSLDRFADWIEANSDGIQGTN